MTRVSTRGPALRSGLAVFVALLATAGCAAGDDRRRPEANSAPAPQSSAPRSPAPESPAPESPALPGPRTTAPAPTLRPEPPLAGAVVVLDPGHQLGNAAHPAEISVPVEAGGFTKPCNTTGTATADGYAEATLTWEVALETRRLLRALGARVVLTRHANSPDLWGPCVDERGRAGNPGEPGPTADVKVSIHADGSLASGAHGFHVIAPEEVAPWTTDIARPSYELAEVVRASLVAEGLATSTYAGRDGIDVRGDLATLNLADVPSVLVELGNMRDDGDAALMTSAAGRRAYASALASAVELFVAG